TVKDAEPLIVPDLAVMVALPGATAVASPALLIVATAAFDEVQVAVLVRFCVVPLLYVPVAVNCCVYPAATEGVAGVTAIETRIGAVPVPLKATDCGLEVPLSTTVRLPERTPRADGLKIIEIVQVAAAARVVGQLLVAAKSDKLVVMLVMVIAEVRVFFSVTFWTELAVPWAWLPNDRLVGLTVWERAGRTAKRAK
ncbi:MAG TPA: hypothetical protein VFF64_09615, partial [Candidatus Eremiobacteraceae bacterium]|nr:hypothetical protein [Candidatus Eremiobacteraceae bacterium]